MKKVAGFDIGNYNIKLVEFEHKKAQILLTRCAVSRIVSGDIKSALKDIISRTKFSLKRVNVSLSGPSVIMRYIEMPSMKEEELKSAIKFEAEKYIPFNLNESIIDCAMLDKTAGGSQRVLLVAAKKGEVAMLLELFKELGLGIDVIDVDSFALLNSFQRIGGDDAKNNTCALINMGAKFSNMNIITQGNDYFTRDILWGGNDITERIKDSMGADAEEAERLKRNLAEKDNEVFNLMTPVLEKLTSQIRMSFDYFESQFGRNVRKIYISGGTSYLFNIVDFLKENLGVDTIIWNPFEGIAVEKSVAEKDVIETPSLFSVAVGLALRK